MVPVAPFAVVTASLDLGTSTASVLAYNGQHGVGNAQAPTVAEAGLSLFVTWATQYEDEYGNSYPTNIKRAEATSHGTAFRSTRVAVVAPNQVSVVIEDAAGNQVSGTVTLVVW